MSWILIFLDCYYSKDSGNMLRGKKKPPIFCQDSKEKKEKTENTNKVDHTYSVRLNRGN